MFSEKNSGTYLPPNSLRVKMEWLHMLSNRGRSHFPERPKRAYTLGRPTN